jgi:hypothetical protein
MKTPLAPYFHARQLSFAAQLQQSRLGHLEKNGRFVAVHDFI